jgi:hypothetical protein
LARRFCVLGARPGRELGLVLVVATLAAALSPDGAWRRLLRINRLALQEQWPEVLAEGRRLPRREYRPAVSLAVNRALYETGQFPSAMFSYPQHVFGITVGMPTTGAEADWFFVRRNELFFQRDDELLGLGLVEHAECEAHNALGIFGHHPVILKRLALVNITKGQPEAARVFLGALSRCVGYRGWARDALRRLEADPLWSDDPEMQQVRSMMGTRSPGLVGQGVEERLDAALRANRRNRMAFEYKMAFYLLTRQLEKFAADLHRLEDFDYGDIPRHYQEAVLIQEAVSGERVDLRGGQIAPEVQEALREFERVRRRFANQGDARVAREALRRGLGDTYFFYYDFGHWGAGHQ